MARALSAIIKELDSVYNPQRGLYNTQLGTIDPQMQAEEQGLEAQKRDSFQQITDQANRRGLFYSGLPIQEEQRYTGSQFLPALANLKGKYAAQRFGLQDAIAKITAEQYGKAQGIYQTELDRDAAEEEWRAQLAAQERASARSAGGGGGGISFGGFGGGETQAAAPKAQGINWSPVIQQGNPWVFKDLLADANKEYFGGKASYGQLAGWLQKQIGNIPNGSAADVALRNIYLGTPLNNPSGGRQSPYAPGTKVTPQNETSFDRKYY